ncbi:MAG: response regulator receiver protein [Candidatus Eremiobacteraeota bacterium]|nr:response regulator receiver protein [Candidatus Eremiobacteraeota bacterium]
MQLNEFHIIQIDDEPDVHEVSRLAMRNFRVYGLPVRLHSAHSKAEGIQLLHSLTLGRPDVSMAAVALIDVVMETDQAGLELCDYIRNVMKNRFLQIYIRTGQPGIAPERAVLDRYDIQGYLAKSEITEDKLYTVVKAGTREAYFTGVSNALEDLLHFLAPHVSSRNGIAEGLSTWLNGVLQYAKSTMTETLLNSICYLAEDRMLCGSEAWAEESAALRRRDELAGLAGVALNEQGDRYFVDGGDFLIQVQPDATHTALYYMARGSVPPPDWEVFLYHRHLRTISALWKQAG